VNRDTSQPLDPDRSLDSNGVRSGHHLYLRRQVVAGGGPAYNEILKDRLIKSEAIDERFVSTVRDLAKEEFPDIESTHCHTLSLGHISIANIEHSVDHLLAGISLQELRH